MTNTPGGYQPNSPYGPQGQPGQQPPYGQGSQQFGQQSPYGSAPQQPSYGQAPQTGPYGQAPQAGPYGQPGGPVGPGGPGQYPGGGLPPAGAPKQSGGLGTGAKVGIGVAALALLGGGVFAASQIGKGGPTTASPAATVSSPRVTTSASAAPTTAASSAAASKPASTAASTKASATASSTKGPKRPDAATVSGDTITSTKYTAKLPSGWKLSDDSGYKDTSLELIDKNNNLISLFDEDTGDPAAVCDDWVEGVRNKPEDKAEKLPDSTWGGLPAKTAKLTTHNDKANDDEIFTFTCAKKGDVVYVLAWVTWPADIKTGEAAFDAVKSSWAWK